MTGSYSNDAPRPVNTCQVVSYDMCILVRIKCLFLDWHPISERRQEPKCLWHSSLNQYCLKGQCNSISHYYSHRTGRYVQSFCPFWVLYCRNIILFFISVSSYSSFIQNCLDSHNAVRAHYGVPALNWSSEIAVGAQKWANHLAGIDQLQHDSTATEGENLFYMYGGDPEQACDRAVKNWYQEVKNYDFRSPHLDDSTSKCV